MAKTTPKMIVHEVDPRPRLVRYEDLPATGMLGRGPRELVVGPLQVALVRRDGRVWLHAPAGALDELVSLRGPGDQALLAPREFQALLSLEGCHFADGYAGTVSLWLRGALVGTDRGADHPLTQDEQAAAGEAGFLRRLRDSCWLCFGPALLRVVEGVNSDVRTRTAALAEAVQGFVRRDGVRAALSRDGLFMFTDELKVHAVESPDRDAHEAVRQGEYERLLADARAATAARAREREESARRLQTAETEATVHKIQGEAATAEQLNALRIAEARIRLVLGKVIEEYRLLEARARAEAAVAAARQGGTPQPPEEVEAMQEEAADLGARLDEVTGAAAALRAAISEGPREDADALDGLSATAAALGVKVEGLSETLRLLCQPAEAALERPLGLTVAWRALDASGTLHPRLDPVATLPTGTWLDVVVTVTHDAWVYVLCRGSTGRWQCLLPDRDDLVGIDREHRQGGGETVRWPGASRRTPDKPYWRLDPNPGIERLVVVASLDPLDRLLAGLLEGGGIGALRRRSAAHAVARRLVPGDGGPSYRRVTETLVGDGCVMQELIIEHVRRL